MIEPSVDYSGSTAVADSAVQSCHPDDPTPTLTSETYAISPADRTRTRVGVGEEVTLVYAPGGATWTIAGEGAISFNDGDEAIEAITFTAGDIAGSVTITATGQYGACSLTFDVVAPSHITIHKKSGTPLKHEFQFVENGFQGLVYLHPNDVNFYRLKIREKDSRAVGTGCCAVATGVLHGHYRTPDPAGGENVSRWISITHHSDAYGSNTSTADTISLRLPHDFSGTDEPFRPGELSCTIVWHWQVNGRHRVGHFPAIHQVNTGFIDGKCQSRKGGDTRFSRFDDETTVPPGWHE